MALRSSRPCQSTKPSVVSLFTFGHLYVLQRGMSNLYFKLSSRRTDPAADLHLVRNPPTHPERPAYRICAIDSRWMEHFTLINSCKVSSLTCMSASAHLPGDPPFDRSRFRCRWSVAASLAVNILIFPKSSEKDLRETLVSSLEHIGELSYLLGKAYALAGSEEERVRRIALTKIMQVSNHMSLYAIEILTLQPVRLFANNVGQ